MTPNLMRSGFPLLVAFATAVSLLVAAPAQAVIVTTPTVTVTVDAPCSGSWSWNQGTGTLSCVTAPTGTTPALANCKFASPPVPAAAGVGFPVTVVCDNGPPTNAATFTWYTKCSGCTATSKQTSTGSTTLTLPTSGTWTVWVEVAAAGNNGTGRVEASLNVTDGIVVGSDSCGPEFANTRRIPLTWASGAGNIHINTAKFGHFGPNDAIVLEISTPAVLGANSHGAFQWSDYYPEPVVNRLVVLSDKACDFTRGLDASPRAIADGYPSGVVSFSTVANDYGLPVVSAPNSKYFLNLKNVPGACQEAHCNLDIEFITPK